MTPAERSLLITLARIVRERIAHVSFDISEINNFRRMMDEEEVTRIACQQINDIPHPDTAMPVRPGALFTKEVFKNWPNPGPAMPERGHEHTGVQSPEGGGLPIEKSVAETTIKRLSEQIEALMRASENQDERMVVVCKARNEALAVLNDHNQDGNIRICEAIVVLAKSIPR